MTLPGTRTSERWARTPVSTCFPQYKRLENGFINTRAFQKVSFLICKVEHFLTGFKLKNNSILATENLKNIERRHKEVF